MPSDGTPAVAERRALTETLRSAGPKADTLCGDWTSAQLAAHLVLRERSVVEMAGRLPVRRFREHAEIAIDHLAETEPYDELVEQFGRGPRWTEVRGPVPVAWLWAVPAVNEAANLLEFLVHNEDVRRAKADWAPRALPADRQLAVWKRLRFATLLTLRSVPVGLRLSWPGHAAIRAGRRRGGPTVTVTGDPVELALFTFGRLAVARVDYDGSAVDVDRVKGADISF
jgi:uncharacterized protein (TIGR03085 family)